MFTKAVTQFQSHYGLILTYEYLVYLFSILVFQSHYGLILTQEVHPL